MFACSSFKRRQNIASWNPWAEDDIPWGQPLLHCSHGNLDSAKLIQTLAMAEVGSFNKDWITKSENPRIFRHSCVSSLLHLSNAADRSQFNINNFLLNFFAFSISISRLIFHQVFRNPSCKRKHNQGECYYYGVRTQFCSQSLHPLRWGQRILSLWV